MADRCRTLSKAGRRSPEFRSQRHESGLTAEFWTANRGPLGGAKRQAKPPSWLHCPLCLAVHEVRCVESKKSRFLMQTNRPLFPNLVTGRGGQGFDVGGPGARSEADRQATPRRFWVPTATPEWRNRVD